MPRTFGRRMRSLARRKSIPRVRVRRVPERETGALRRTGETGGKARLETTPKPNPRSRTSIKSPTYDTSGTARRSKFVARQGLRKSLARSNPSLHRQAGKRAVTCKLPVRPIRGFSRSFPLLRRSDRGRDDERQSSPGGNASNRNLDSHSTKPSHI